MKTAVSAAAAVVLPIPMSPVATSRTPLAASSATIAAPASIACSAWVSLIAGKTVTITELDETASRLARDLAGYSPAALALAKEAFYNTLELPYAQALPYLRDLLTIVARSEDAREGLAAFREKRPPRWTGR